MRGKSETGNERKRGGGGGEGRRREGGRLTKKKAEGYRDHVKVNVKRRMKQIKKKQNGQIRLEDREMMRTERKVGMRKYCTVPYCVT